MSSSKKPCVYIMYYDSLDAYYIGQTKDLLSRYTLAKLAYVFYTEDVENKETRLRRENELIVSFREKGVILLNDLSMADKVKLAISTSKRDPIQVQMAIYNM